MGKPGEHSGAREAVIGELRALLGKRLDLSQDTLNEHACDVSHHAPHPPDAVAFPSTTDEVSRIVKICGAHRMPVIPFGTGTAVEGGVLALRGGICVDMSRMNHVLRISESDMDATVESGVTRKQLNQYLQERNTQLYFPVDPGADASLGGMASTRASGSAAVRYGTMRENVLGLTAVVGDGTVIQTGGRARKSSAGYDLTRLLVGSEGTLAIITEVTLRLARLPEAISAAVCPFGDIESAVDAVIAVMSAGIPMARIELLDEVQMGAVNRYSNLEYKEAPTLFFEFHGTNSAVVEQAERVAGIVAEHHGGKFEWATRREDRDRLWQARHDAYYASLALRDGSVGYVTDVCVPISELAGCIQRAKQLLRSTEIPAPLFGHVGDGNYHVVFAIDPSSEAELNEVRQLSEQLVDDALRSGGTCTGEHGIGIGKRDALKREYPAAIAVMRSIKQALDPHGIMNPGKVIAE